jgi:hypothetical protein
VVAGQLDEGSGVAINRIPNLHWIFQIAFNFRDKLFTSHLEDLLTIFGFNISIFT